MHSLRRFAVRALARLPPIFIALPLMLAACSGSSPRSQNGASGGAPGTGGATAGGAPAQAGGAPPGNASGGANQASSGGTTSPPGGAGAQAMAGSSGSRGSAGMGAMPGSGGAPGPATGNGGATGSGGVAPGGNGGSFSGGAAGTGGATVTDAQTLVPDPSWTCGMADGIPPPTSGALVLEANATLGQIYDIGDTQYGHRYMTEIKGGAVTGPRIQATLMDRGLDYQLTLSNGAVELEELNILQTSDGASIYFRSCGTAPGPDAVVRTVPDFEAPNAGPYAFLNTAKLVGTRELDMAKKTLRLRVYEVTAPAPTDKVTITDPKGVPDQTWDCKKASGTKGAVVYTESVGIGAGSVAVGASKRGTRNIIPITGGTTSGRVAGTVLSGGADYQIIGTAFELDARYTIHTGDGEMIIVRNCGPVGALVPVFETRTSGAYAFLNANTWLSSDPSIGAGVVNLTIYEGK